MRLIARARTAAALAALTALTPVVAPAADTSTLLAERRPLALDDLNRLRDVEDPRVSPDGAWVAYTVTTPNVEADAPQSDLWMTNWEFGTTLRLTTTPKASESHPRWSPDGHFLAFLSDRADGKTDQLWSLPRAGGEAEQLTALGPGVEDFAWSPEGARFLLAVADSDSVTARGAGAGPADGEEKVPPPLVIDRFYFKEDMTGYLTHKRVHLYLFDIATRKLERLTEGDNDDVSPAWSPDGRSIAFLSKRGPEADRSNSWEIYVVEARPGAAPRQLTHFEGRVNNPGGEMGHDGISWSPDGRQIAFLQGGPPELLYYAVNHLAVVPSAGGPVRVLTADVDRWVFQPAFAPDGQSVYARLEDDATFGLVRVPLAGGPPEPLLTGRRAVEAFDVSPTGHIAALVGTPEAPPEVFAVGAGAPRPLSRQNHEWLAGLRLGATEETRFKSPDGTDVHGFIVKPPDYRAGVRYPTILSVHGGPVGQFYCEFTFEWQLYAAQGYVVVAANPRGGSGRGEAYCRILYRDWGHKDVEDVLAAVDDVVARGLADPARLGIGGWSYGGMLTNYVIVQDQRFKAATSGASISNVIAGYGTDMYVREYEAEFGPPWKNPEGYLKVSAPFLHADRITTPTLFLCGEKDYDVPVLNSEQMYQSLRSLGVETQLVIYPDQFHELTRPSYRVDNLQRYLDWFGRHLGGGTPSAGKRGRK